MTTVLRRIWTNPAQEDNRTGVCSVKSIQHDYQNWLCRKKAGVCIHVCACTFHAQNRKLSYDRWLSAVANVRWKNEISLRHHSIYVGISSQLKSEVATILRTTSLTSLSSLLDLFFQDSIDVVIQFYCVRLVYIPANLQLITLSSFRTSCQRCFMWPCGSNVRQWFFFANSLRFLLFLYENKKRKAH